MKAVLEAYLVPLSVLWPILAFSMLRFENQRWIRSIRSGKTGDLPIVSLLVNITGFLGILVIIASYVVFVWQAGFGLAVATFVANLVFGLVVGTMLSVIIRGDNFAVWLLSTIAMWPVGLILVTNVYREFLE